MSTKEGYPKGQAKREEIVATTMRMIRDNGFDNFSLRDVAVEVGLSQAGLLYYFSSKAELLTEVLRENDNADLARLKNVLGNTDLRRIRTSAMGKERTNHAVAQLRSVLQAQAIDEHHPAHAFIISQYNTMINATEEILRDAQKSGQITPEISPKILAQIVAAFGNGLESQWMIDDPAEFSTILTTFFSLLSPPHTT